MGRGGGTVPTGSGPLVLASRSVPRQPEAIHQTGPFVERSHLDLSMGVPISRYTWGGLPNSAMT